MEAIERKLLTLSGFPELMRRSVTWVRDVCTWQHPPVPHCIADSQEQRYG